MRRRRKTPGLGVVVDEEALERYRVDVADLRLPRRLVRYRRPCGVEVYFANDSHNTSPMWNYFADGQSAAVRTRRAHGRCWTTTARRSSPSSMRVRVKAPVLMRALTVAYTGSAALVRRLVVGSLLELGARQQ